MTTKLDTNVLEDAIGQLAKAIGYATSEMAKKDKGLFEQFRNSTVQCFEFTFELGWKFIKRILEIEHPSPDQIDQWDYKELIREAAVRGLVSNPELWFEFRRLRNLSSHAYDKTKAEQVYKAAEKLKNECEFLFKQIKSRN